ncbi:hypothetical protein ALC62_11752 [Cyphomyrmex costatus]|uniref:Uncharacterized protein n=1 Tax=Cyphomyrmex costatus TaxID=456900 RepID=A0A195C9S1_9HYME|nr:hypothetical protein ALC62_11752 [Cyphomyrmex costatus]
MPVVRVYFWVTDGWLFVAREREPTMGTNAYRLPACVCVRGYKRACSQYAKYGETEKERYGDKRAHTFLLVMRYHRVGTVTHRRFRCVYAPLMA